MMDRLSIVISVLAEWGLECPELVGPIIAACSLVVAIISLAVAFYTAYAGAKFQLELHVMKVIADRAKEANGLWIPQPVAEERIRSTITLVIRTIQLVCTIQRSNPWRLRKKSVDIFKKALYFKLNDSFHNKICASADVDAIVHGLISKEDATLSQHIAFVQHWFKEIHDSVQPGREYTSC